MFKLRYRGFPENKRGAERFPVNASAAGCASSQSFALGASFHRQPA
ncbi:hypothetical protein [Chitinophaga sp. XS-30]|nr:hypothetical protein [Chitinophaga sp. XS-30]